MPETKTVKDISFKARMIRLPLDIIDNAKKAEKEIESQIKKNTNILGKLKLKTDNDITNFKNEVQKNFNSLLIFYYFFEGTYGFDKIKKYYNEAKKKIDLFNKKNENNTITATFNGFGGEAVNQGINIATINIINQKQDNNNLDDIITNNQVNKYVNKNKNDFKFLNNNKNKDFNEQQLNTLKTEINNFMQRTFDFPLFKSLQRDFDEASNANHYYKKYCIYLICIKYVCYEISKRKKQKLFLYLKNTLANGDNVNLASIIQNEINKLSFLKEFNQNVKEFKTKYNDSYKRFYKRYADDKSSSTKKFTKTLVETHQSILECFKDYEFAYKVFNGSITSPFKAVRSTTADNNIPTEKLSISIFTMKYYLNNFINYITSTSARFDKFYDNIDKLNNQITDNYNIVLKNYDNFNNRIQNIASTIHVISDKEMAQREQAFAKLYELLKKKTNYFEKEYNSFQEVANKYYETRTIKGKLKHFIMGKLPKFMERAARLLVLIGATGGAVATGNYGAILQIALHARGLMRGEQFATENIITLLNQLNSLYAQQEMAKLQEQIQAEA